jgi:hypothetical protein
MMATGHRSTTSRGSDPGVRGYRAIARRRRQGRRWRRLTAQSAGGRCAAWIQLKRSAARSARLPAFRRMLCCHGTKNTESSSSVGACVEARVWAERRHWQATCRRLGGRGWRRVAVGPLYPGGGPGSGSCGSSCRHHYCCASRDAKII